MKEYQFNRILLGKALELGVDSCKLYECLAGLLMFLDQADVELYSSCYRHKDS